MNNLFSRLYVTVKQIIINIYQTVTNLSFNSSTVIHLFFIILLIMYSAPLLTVIFCIWQSSYFTGKPYTFITSFALSYNPDSAWRNSIANIIMPLITAFSVSLLKPINKDSKTDIRIPAYLVIIGITLLLGAAAAIVCNQIIIAHEASFEKLYPGGTAYNVLNSITTSAIKEYLSFFAILFGISATKLKE